MISGNHGYADKPVQISVMIPTKRPQQLDAYVKGMLASDHKSFEVIVVDESPEPYALILHPRLHIHQDYFFSEGEVLAKHVRSIDLMALPNEQLAASPVRKLRSAFR